MNPRFGILFDLDGVLIDSGPCHEVAWTEFAARRGGTLPKDFFQKTFGMKNDLILKQLPNLKLESADFVQLSEEKESIFREGAKGKIQLLPGVRKFLEECRKDDIPRIIATCTPRSNMEFLLREVDLASFVPEFICADDVAHGKPDPEIFLKAAARLKIEPCRCVVFEDAFAGVQAAKAAGAKCIAVATTRSQKELNEGTQADLVVRSMEDVTLERVAPLVAEQF